MSQTEKMGEEGGLRSNLEKEASLQIAETFESNRESTETKLTHFAKYAKRQSVTKYLARYEIFKSILHTKGSIVECGVFHGAGLMSWANFSAVLEPNNLMRKVYGFDSFDGFPSISSLDRSKERSSKTGDLKANSYDELLQLIDAFDKNRYLGHIPKVQLVKGDATKTIPQFIEENKHLVVSLLFLDFDLYEPTKVAIQNFVPRMPKGSIIAFDEIDHPAWPGETLALLDSVGISSLRIKRHDFDPYIGFAVIGD